MKPQEGFGIPTRAPEGTAKRPMITTLALFSLALGVAGWIGVAVLAAEAVRIAAKALVRVPLS